MSGCACIEQNCRSDPHQKVVPRWTFAWAQMSWHCSPCHRCSVIDSIHIAPASSLYCQKQHKKAQTVLRGGGWGRILESAQRCSCLSLLMWSPYSMVWNHLDSSFKRGSPVTWLTSKGHYQDQSQENNPIDKIILWTTRTPPRCIMEDGPFQVHVLSSPVWQNSGTEPTRRY